MSDVVDQGEGRVLVFLHGAGVDTAMWAPQAAAFSSRYRVIVPLLPGHGNSPAVDSVEEMAKHVRALLKARGVSRYAVIGLSLGGMVALEMAARWPEEVTHLAMIEAVPNVTDNRLALAVTHTMLGLLRVVPPKLLAKLPARHLGAESPAAAQYLRQALPCMTARNNCRVLRIALAYDGRPHLPMISMPTLVMVGEKNKATHARARAMAQQIEHSRFIIVPGAGHIANLDKPQLINDALQHLLAGEG